MVLIGTAVVATVDWSQAAARFAKPDALQTAASEGDLLAHLVDLAERGQLTDFLALVDRAIGLAQCDPTFAAPIDKVYPATRTSGTSTMCRSTGATASATSSSTTRINGSSSMAGAAATKRTRC